MARTNLNPRDVKERFGIGKEHWNNWSRGGNKDISDSRRDRNRGTIGNRDGNKGTVGNRDRNKGIVAVVNVLAEEKSFSMAYNS